MWSPEECVQSCVSVCKGIHDIHGNAWPLMLLVFLIGFLTGRKLDAARLVLAFFLGLPSPDRDDATPARSSDSKKPRRHTSCNDTTCLTHSSCKVRKAKSSDGKETIPSPKVTSAAVAKPPPGTSDHKPEDQLLATPVSAEPSPKSDSGQSTSSSCSSSPLLAGSISTTVSPTSSLELSPFGAVSGASSPLSRRLDAEDIEDVVCHDEIDELEPTTSEKQHRKPKPVIIPAYIDTLDRNSPSPTVSTPSVDNSTLPAVAWMCGRNIHFGNERWLDLINRSLEGLYGKEWTLCCHPDDFQHCKSIVLSASASKAPFQMEYRLKILGNQYRWILDIAKPRISAAGEFFGYVGWRIDIHERKMIEEKYVNFWTLPHEFLVNWVGDGRYFDKMSTALPATLGYDYEEFRARPYLSFVHEDDVQSTMEAAQSLRDGNVVVNFANRYRCGPNPIGPVWIDSTGIYKWILWTASQTCGAGKDITSVKLVEEELRQSQQELRRAESRIYYQVCKKSGVFVYRVNTEGKESFPYMSKGALEMLGPHTIDSTFAGLSSNNRRAFGMTVHAADWDDLREEMLESQISTAPFDHHFRIESHRKDVAQWVRVHAVPKLQEDGSTEWSGIALDETIAHETLDALKEARDSAERLAQTKATFLAHMSHEIRTPMNSVVGMCTLLLDTPLTDEQRDYASTIRHSGDALIGIINDILDYSKIEAGKMELEFRPIFLARCVEETFDSIAPQAAAKSLELTFSIADCVPKALLADVTRIRQILINLLSNAVKFTSRGGVSVSVKGDRTAGNTWEILFSVSDTGPGIPANRKNYLFQAFTQIDASTTRKYGGTGLGLVICARLCKLHGGRIWVESELGSGSTFHFTIRAEETCIADAKDERMSGLRGKRVLLVDGYSSNTQTMCASILKSFEMRPVCAISSKEAWTLLNTDANHSFFAAIFNNTLFDAAENRQATDCVTFCHEESHIIPTILLCQFGDRHKEYFYPDSHEEIRFEASVSKPVKELQLRDVLMSFTPHAAQHSVAVPSARSLLEVSKACPLRILVAEDNLVNRKVITKLLGRLGYTVDVAENGLIALTLASKSRYDVCLMDCYMPEMDGLEACRRIRREVNPAPLIVAVTAAALEEEMKQCYEAGMCMCLCKPVNADDLKQTLERCWHILNP